MRPLRATSGQDSRAADRVSERKRITSNVYTVLTRAAVDCSAGNGYCWGSADNSGLEASMRRLTKIAAVAVVSIVGLFASSAQAASITVISDPGTTFTTTGFTGFSTFGDDMVGMLVTAFFSDGSSQTVAWTANGAGAGHAVGTGWSLSESGD